MYRGWLEEIICGVVSASDKWCRSSGGSSYMAGDNFLGVTE